MITTGNCHWRAHPEQSHMADHAPSSRRGPRQQRHQARHGVNTRLSRLVMYQVTTQMELYRTRRGFDQVQPIQVQYRKTVPASDYVMSLFQMASTRRST